MLAINAPRGTKDVLPSESSKWQYVESIIREHCRLYGFREIRTPIFEHTELFQRGVGETTDIVQKEMYTFLDRGERSITLKPEGTSPAVRAFIENNLYNEALPEKLYYMTPVFRYERPQAGRLREHHQFGVEVFGAADASVDAEIISLALEFFNKLGVKGLSLDINSIGCPKCRKEYNKALKEYLKSNFDNLCGTCKDRYDRNPLRILDCKVESCQEIVKGAPIIIDYLCDDCKEHFQSLKQCLDELGYEYNVNPMIVRGLDYYTKTVFEIISNDIGTQSTVCGGGRYDGLIKECGGPDLPAVGFGMGLERLLLVLESQGIKLPIGETVDVFIASIGDNAKLKASKIINDLRKNNISADMDYMDRSLKGQMKYANKLNAKYTVILGDNEIESGKISLKNMKTSQQVEINLSDLYHRLKEEL